MAKRQGGLVLMSTSERRRQQRRERGQEKGERRSGGSREEMKAKGRDEEARTDLIDEVCIEREKRFECHLRHCCHHNRKARRLQEHITRRGQGLEEERIGGEGDGGGIGGRRKAKRGPAMVTRVSPGRTRYLGPMTNLSPAASRSGLSRTGLLL
eukprot:758080-Hanusia_phi.AAC.6